MQGPRFPAICATHASSSLLACAAIVLPRRSRGCRCATAPGALHQLWAADHAQRCAAPLPAPSLKVIAFVDDPTGYKFELIQREGEIPEPLAQASSTRGKGYAFLIALRTLRARSAPACWLAPCILQPRRIRAAAKPMRPPSFSRYQRCAAAGWPFAVLRLH